MKKKNEIERNWWLVDAKGQILGRLASRIAMLLRGKNKPSFFPYKDLGDYVVVINAKDIKVTGKKREEKIYWHHTGYPGGLKKETLNELLKEKPTEALKKAILGMLPKNKLKKFWLKRLYIYPEKEHPFSLKELKIWPGK